MADKRQQETGRARHGGRTRTLRANPAPPAGPAAEALRRQPIGSWPDVRRTRFDVAAFVAVFLAVVPVAATAQEPVERSRIVVRGTGSVPVAPDRARILFSLESRASSPAVAANGTAEIQTSTVAALRSAGIADDAVVSVGYSVAPDWRRDEHGNQELGGYVASSSVLVETDALERVGELIDIALAAGVTGIRSVMFEASNVDAARREALAAATEQARLDAEAIAAAAGGQLGQLIEITLEEPDTRAGVVVRRYSPPATQLEPGQLFVMATVLASWRFEDG